jgi:hypothetical protein
MNPGLHGEKPATDYLSWGMAQQMMKKVLVKTLQKVTIWSLIMTVDVM